MLSKPANPEWLMARIAALLLPYYEKTTPDGVRQMDAEDWMAALGDEPRWAVESAVRWWKSSDNPKRRMRPIEGDIQDRIKIEMDAVNAARVRLENGSLQRKQDLEDAQRVRVSGAKSAEIMAAAGFGPVPASVKQKMESAVATVEAKSGIEFHDIVGASRVPSIVAARDEAIWICVKDHLIDRSVVNRFFNKSGGHAGDVIRKLAIQKTVKGMDE